MTAGNFTIFVPGKPATKGSAKGFAYMKDGKPRAAVTHDNSRTAPWEAMIRETIRLQGLANEADLAAPCEVRVTCKFHRPKKHYRTGSRERELREDAPWFAHMTEKPDGDKTLRLALDALTGVAFLDDKQVCSASVTKLWADRWSDPEGTEIDVRYYDPETWKAVRFYADNINRQEAEATR